MCTKAYFEVFFTSIDFHKISVINRLVKFILEKIKRGHLHIISDENEILSYTSPFTLYYELRHYLDVDMSTFEVSLLP